MRCLPCWNGQLKNTNHTAIGIIIGGAVGVMIGIAIDNPGLGIGVGIAIGAAVGQHQAGKPDDTDNDH